MASIARTGLLRQTQCIAARPVTFASKQIPSSNAALRIAPFTSSAQRGLLPPGPQVIEGGVNDPAPVPKPHPTHGSYHWTAERALSIGLIPLTIAPFAAQSMNPTLDALFVGGILIHTHMGFQSVITDYIPDYRYPKSRKAFTWGLNLATILVGIGFYEFETNDVGLCEAVKRVWRAGANDATIGAADITSLGHDGKLKHLTE